MYAAESMDITKMKMLLEHGAVKEGKDKNGKMVLSIANGKNKCFGEAVKRLLKE
jgi:hypothetical protein